MIYVAAAGAIVASGTGLYIWWLRASLGSTRAQVVRLEQDLDQVKAVAQRMRELAQKREGEITLLHEALRSVASQSPETARADWLASREGKS